MQVEQFGTCISENEIKKTRGFLHIIIKNFDWRCSLLAFVFSMLGPWWITYIALQKISFAKSWIFFVGSELVINLSFLLLITACTHFTAGLWGGNGKASDLFTLTGFAFLPRLLLVPLATLLLFLPTFLAFFLFVVFALTITMCILLLLCRSVIFVYGFSQGRALLTVVFLPILLLIFYFIAIFFMSAGIFNVFI